MRALKLAALALLGAISVSAFPSTSRADLVFVQNSDDSSGQVLGINPNNQIVVQDLGGGTLQINVNLAPNWGLVNTGASGNGGSLTFGLTGFGSLLFGAVNPASFAFDHTPPINSNVWHPVGTTPAAGTTSISATAAALSAPGKFSFSSGYGMEYDSAGGSSPFVGLKFTINAAGLTLATFLANLQSSGGSFFFADVINNNLTGANRTGLIDFGLQAVPLPPAALLFGTALVGMGILGRRRRKDKVA